VTGWTEVSDERFAGHVRVALVVLLVGPLHLVTGCRPAATQPVLEPSEMIARLIETNRSWLLQTPPGITNFEYVLNRAAGSRRFEVDDAAHASNARRQGVTYYSILQHLARNPQSASVTRVEPQPGGFGCR
jgi:hypothetical protein